MLAEAIVQQPLDREFTPAIHDKSIRLLSEYLTIGGMPEAVHCWVTSSDPNACLLELSVPRMNGGFSTQ